MFSRLSATSSAGQAEKVGVVQAAEEKGYRETLEQPFCV